MKSRCISYLLAVILWGIGLNLNAQQQPVRFRHISYKDGLVQSPIATLLQDKSGYIWIGSWTGLSRYDGSGFKNFRPNDSTTTHISHNRINRLFEDRQGHLWIGTGNGLNLYDKKTEHFQHVGLSSAKGGGNFITTIEQDDSGKIWVATFKGIKYVTPDNKGLSTINSWRNKEPELYQGIAFSLAEDNLQTMWAGVRQGLKRFDPKSMQVLPLPEVLRTNKDLSTAKVVVVKQDANANMWFGTENSGVFRYSARQNTCVQFVNKSGDPHSLPSNWINDLLIKDGHLLAATRNGLAIFDAETNTFTNYTHNPADSKTLSDGSVWSLTTDHTGNVWMGTFSGGINILYPGNSNFNNIGEKVGNNIGLNKPLAEAIAGDIDGGLWIGAFGGGLNYINRQKNIADFYPVSDEIKALVKDPAGNLWAGTIDGLFKFNRNAKTFTHIDLATINNKTAAKLINALKATNNGIWVGTNGAGLKLVDYRGKEILTLISKPGQYNSLSDNYVNALCLQDSILWIGTQNGLSRYDLSTHLFTTYRRKNAGLGNNNVLALFADSRHRLWIGTDGGGLNYLDQHTNRIYKLRQSDGLADDMAAGIIEDNKGALWVSTNNGISQLTFGLAAFPLQKGNYHIENYTAANGLQSNQFSVNSVYKTADGELLFGGMNGVTTFYPDRIIKNKFRPDILMTGLLINNKDARDSQNPSLQTPVNEASEVTLPYDQNNLTIKFSALNFINPEKNQYAYKMAGLTNNRDWLSTGNQKEVSFTNLSPGHYTFTVKAANNDGYWNNAGRTLQIIIRPPIWATWWAYLLYVALAVFIFYKVIQFFQIRARLEQDLFNEHLQNERQEEFYKMKLDFFTNISHEIRTPLTLILGPVENLYQNTLENTTINRQVLQVKNNAERLLRLIGELMDFRKAETGNMVLYVQQHNVAAFIKEIFLSFTSLAESRQITYEFNTASHEIYLNIDHDQLEKVFFNLLSNDYKCTPDGGSISVTVNQNEREGFSVSIADNGKGISPEHQSRLFTNYYQVRDEKSNAGTGIGLALSKSIVELHQGRISFKSSPQTINQPGHTVFTVYLPADMKPATNVHIIGNASGSENIASFRRQSEIDILPAAETFTTDKVSGTIVLAEDNEELRRFLVDSLPGYQVSAFENGSDALKYAVAQIPDLVISDVMMPVMDGLEFCRCLRADERTSHIPVILLTALAAHIHQVNGLQTGADVYLTKPFSTKLLQLNVLNLLASRELMRKKFSQQLVLQPKQVLLNNPDEQFIQKLMHIIEEKMEDPEFGVVGLGSEIGMSKTVLYKKITALTDLSPADFIKSMRLKKASDLLQQGILTINEVSVMVGFNDRKYFSREFKKMFGKSPSEVV